MGNKSSKKSKKDTNNSIITVKPCVGDIYLQDHVRIHDVPRIALTTERRTALLKRESTLITTMDNELLMKLINGYSSYFTIEMICEIIKLNNQVLFECFYKLNDKHFTPISDNHTKVLEESIKCNNKYMIAWIIDKFKYDKGYQKKICKLLSKYKLEDTLVHFINNNDLTEWKYREYYAGNYWCTTFPVIEEMYTNNISEETMIELFDIHKYIHSNDITYKSYVLACNCKYEDLAIKIFDILDNERWTQDVLYIACKNKLVKLANHIYTKCLLDEKHFKRQDNNQYDTIEEMINNDMFDTFNKYISFYFNNLGKIQPINASDDFGKYLMMVCLKQNYVTALFKYITYDNNFLRNLFREIHIENIEIVKLFTEKIGDTHFPNEISNHKHMSINNSYLELSISKANNSRMPINNNNYDLSELV